MTEFIRKNNKNNKKNKDEKSHQSDRLEHEQILAQGKERFPEESYQQLLAAGANSEEALEMLGFTPERKPLAQG